MDYWPLLIVWMLLAIEGVLILTTAPDHRRKPVTYDKLKREIVLWAALAAGLGQAFLASMDAPRWLEMVVLAVAAFVARSGVTPVTDPRDITGRPLTPEGQ